MPLTGSHSPFTVKRRFGQGEEGLACDLEGAQVAACAFFDRGDLNIQPQHFGRARIAFQQTRRL